jgi:tetratricopeptide (TPR) repeat protein
MMLLDRLREATPRARRALLIAAFTLLSVGVLLIVAWPDPVEVRLLWTAPDRLVALWSCAGSRGWPLLLTDAAFAVGAGVLLLLLLSQRPADDNAPRAAAIAWFVVAAAAVALIRDAAILAIARIRPDLAPGWLPYFRIVGWLVPALAAMFVLASRPPRGEAAPPSAPGTGGAPTSGGFRIFGFDLLGAVRVLLDSGAAVVIAALTVALLATTFWSRSTFVIQRIVLPEAKQTGGMTAELVGSIFATELRRATNAGFSIHSQNVSVRELADVADWTVPGSQISLRSILSNFLRGERVTIAVSGGEFHWNVFVATSSGIAIVVSEKDSVSVSLTDKLQTAAKLLLEEECNGAPSEVLRPACALVHLQRGDGFLDTERRGAAKEAYATALDLDSEGGASSLIYVSRGRLYGGGSDDPATRFERAEADYARAERCVAAIPSVPARAKILMRIHHHWGEVSLDAGQRDDAVRHFSRAIAADPTSAYGYHDLGRLALGEGRWDAAERLFSFAIQADPSFANSYCDRAEARKRQRSPQLERALEDFGTATRIATQSDVLCGYLGRATVLGKLGRTDEAKAALREIVESERLLGIRRADPKWIWAYKELGDLEAARGACAAAAQWYGTAERAEAAVQWRSAGDRREVLTGIYEKWIDVLAPTDPEHAVVSRKRAELQLAVAETEPARPPVGAPPPELTPEAAPPAAPRAGAGCR